MGSYPETSIPIHSGSLRGVGGGGVKNTSYELVYQRVKYSNRLPFMLDTASALCREFSMKLAEGLSAKTSTF